MGRTILGIKYISHDTAAALMVDGKVIAACEQERYTLDKHSRVFPLDAIHDCLRIAGITMDGVDEIAFGGDPELCLRRTYLEPALEDYKRVGMMIQEFERIREIYHTEDLIREKTGFSGPISFFDHHLAHLASSYYPSGFQDAIVLSIDGIGDFKTMKLAIGRSGALDVVREHYDYPHSLGLVYAAITCYLGWKNVHHEGVIMALACYGDYNALVPGQKRSYYAFFEDIIHYDGEYDIRINQDWMSYYYVRDRWVSDRFIDVFGPRRQYDMATLNQHHMNIAAALQKRLEDVVITLLKNARRDYGVPCLCMGGGVALNCSMNGKIEQAGIFDEIFVQPASGDAGLAIGACYLAQRSHDPNYAPVKSHNYYLGAAFSAEEIEHALKASGLAYTKPEDLYNETARRLKEGKVVAWYQGRSEFGPRALGNRSILARPFPAGMKDHINDHVKFREYFRPLAPAVMKEHLHEYFQIGQESPHMLIACLVQPDKKDEIPATVHVDDSCRAQSVGPENNERFYKLLKAFKEQTGCPVLLNTSFNVKGQPIINTPEQAIECFRTHALDVLVLDDFLLEK
ncbi:carbamoyl transferase [candidate division KSB3 bacterium]|uniref:Carbamoyl transferase n=1 Tax=candidate division KSB3 bacterium TaxID=2044937 RepID=A0A2G6EDX8_9BACT|nr:MAG: carbamoyl transferase [candidate division KSB3 bacterium]